MQDHLSQKGFDIPIVFITAHADETIKARARPLNEAKCSLRPDWDLSSSHRFRSRSIAAFTASSMSCSWKGLVRKSTAPPFIALTDVEISPCAVRKIIGILMLDFSNSA